MHKHKDRVYYWQFNSLAKLCIVVIISAAMISCGGNVQDPQPEEGALSPPEAVEEQPQPEVDQEEGSEVEPAQQVEQETQPFTISSPDFNEGEPIPIRFSCDGGDNSPALGWEGHPENTASFVLVMDDPDAPVGTWVHWVMFNLPGDLQGLPESMSPEAVLPNGVLHGLNSWERSDYGGPCPPSGTHRYFFKLYALDTFLDLPEGATLEAVQAGMEGHLLDEVSLMGIYTR